MDVYWFLLMNLINRNQSMIPWLLTCQLLRKIGDWFQVWYAPRSSGDSWLTHLAVRR